MISSRQLQTKHNYTKPMPNSEQSFVDRAQKSHALLSALNVFTPVFTPPDEAISMVNFSTYLNTVDSANLEVENTRSFLAVAQAVRRSASEGAQKLVTQIVNFVKSNPAWKVDFSRIKELADKVRTVRPKARQPAIPPPTPLKPRDRGDGSYAEIAQHFKALSAKLVAMPAYVPPDVNIQTGAIGSLASQLEANNDAVDMKVSDYDRALKVRYAFYFDEETGLAVKFAAIKAAVKGQYGQGSTQFAQVRGMRW